MYLRDTLWEPTQKICVWVLFIHNPQKEQLAKVGLGLRKATNRAIKHRMA